MPEDLNEDFRTSGLTHLLAVSGTNLTLVVGSLLLLARWAGVRARGLVVVGALGVVGFVLLARTEPSVVRAAAMGSVGLIGMGHHGRRRGTRALGAAVLLLLLFDPWLALSMGFALSVLATAGILWLAPGWRDRLMRWLPRWVAEAVSVPLAAQLACTPLVAAISGQVSLVAVVANLLAAPAVGPATVLGPGRRGGRARLPSRSGRIVAAPAAWCAGWIIAVAVRGADLPVAAVRLVGAGPVGIAILTVLCAALSLFLRRAAGPAGHHAGPGRGDGAVPCWSRCRRRGGRRDGLGDGRVRRRPGRRAGAQRRRAARPWWSTPVRTRRRWTGACAGWVCERVPLVVLTHFHADHVDGLEGVLKGRAGRRDRGHLAGGPGRRASGWCEAVAARAGVPVQRASYGETRRLGPLSWQVIAPVAPAVARRRSHRPTTPASCCSSRRTGSGSCCWATRRSRRRHSCGARPGECGPTC